MRIPTIFIALAFGCTSMLLVSCKKDKDEVADIDRELYQLARDTSAITWYKFSDLNLVRSSGSGHPQPFLRTRYNAIASSQLDSIGMVDSSAVFPESSLIVKELIGSGGGIERYAIMLKRSGSAYADSQGWVWGYVNADGSVDRSATKKGDGCISCHSQAGNINATLMNAWHP